MGCVYSKVEFENPNPRIFQVWNVDGEGRNIKPGRIEVSESQLVLYQRGDITVRWPLKSLRRYGFDAELFSFECGRRCPTGPGVYAFKCRRAEALFNVLQESLQNSGGTNGAGNVSIASVDDQSSISTQVPSAIPFGSSTNVTNVASGSTHNSNARQTPAVDSSGYLEPITANNHLQRTHTPNSSRSGAVASTSANSPGSNSVCVHSLGSEGMTVEWTAQGKSSTMPSCCSFGPCNRATSSSHQYVNREVVEQFSPSFSSSVSMTHQYVNASVISSDPSRRGCSLKCQSQSQSLYVNSQVVNSTSLPSCSGSCSVSCMHCVDVNTNYAKLDDLLKQEQSVKRQKEQQHCYVNVKPDQPSSSTGACCRCMSEGSTATGRNRGVISPVGKPASLKGHRPQVYTNLGSSKSIAAFEAPKIEVKTQVNYAVLDLDNNNTTHAPPTSSGCSVPNTPARTPEGYVQIDFDRTVALSNSIIPCANDESLRKTRHSAVLPCSSMPS